MIRGIAVVLIGFIYCLSLNAQMKHIYPLINHPSCASGGKYGYIHMVHIGLKEPVSYAWSYGGKGAESAYLKAGTYTVTATDASLPPQVFVKEIELLNNWDTVKASYQVYCDNNSGTPFENNEYKVRFFDIENCVYPVKIYEIANNDTSICITIAKKPKNTWDWPSCNFWSKNTQFWVADSSKNCPALIKNIVPKNFKFGTAYIELIDTKDKYYVGEEVKAILHSNIPLDSCLNIKWFSGLIDYNPALVVVPPKKEYKAKDTCSIKIDEAREHYNFMIYVQFFHEASKCTLVENKWFQTLDSIKSVESIYCPNIFSPNQDQINDQLTIYGAKDVEKVISMRVFDQWGNLIFEQKDFPPNDNHYGWDGTYKGIPANQGIYTCSFVLLLTSGKEKIVNNSVQLSR